MLNPAIRFGIIVGLISLVINIFTTGLLALCGPVFALVTGAAAGFFAAHTVQGFVGDDRAEVGATAGAVAGAFVLVGHLIRIIDTLLYM